MKITGIEWDSGNWPKCNNHGVSKCEIEYVLKHTTFRIPDPNPNEIRFRTALKALTGRYIFVVYTHRQYTNSIYLRPISARYMHQEEIDYYEQIKKSLANANNR